MSAGEVITTSSTGGQKAGNDIRMSLVPIEILDVAELYGKGAKKYADHNWRKGYEWSKSYDAMMRHAMAWWDGEEFDNGEGGTGLEHLTAVIFHALALMYFRKNFPEFDDRFKGPQKTAMKVGEVVFPKISHPKKVDKLNEEWMRKYTWNRVTDDREYAWRDPDWCHSLGGAWLRSGENDEPGSYGPFTRD
ncbi:hypothetical protein PROPHIGD54-2_89 [Mycobacterium phage prophiGD54-2]|uniref:dATP/dGTP diphosphohydrolase domain-containing protein n=1 Tax=Mycobacteroides abscessus TaxID=36809 RepID=UPI0019D23FB4|nr:dATP/dGTP diphosphohydrolase domain-containing protein [Mycobacteroides abscessus]QSM04689.1 hypothetical protein PROPHIGD54-2_89 [Mycobacterium phage prophiGD54-2]QSN19617.1 hypothetical protein I3U41_17060 [Mycobacteroides abscessus subsp. abscessus]